MLMKAEQLDFARGEDIPALPEITSGRSLSLDEIHQRVGEAGRDVRADVFSLVYFDRLKPIPGVGSKPATYVLPEFFQINTRGRLR